MEHENQPRSAWEPAESLRIGKIHGAVTGRWRSDGRVTHTVYPVKHMVVTGGLTTGFTFYGPFDSVGLARQWAGSNLRTDTFYRINNMFEVRDGE